MTQRIVKSFGCGLFLFLLQVIALISVSAQTVTSYSPTKGSTPVSLAPGSPAGSYPLSGFDTLNPYNLSMNFRLPLLQVGGRGEAGYTMMLPIQRQWRVNKTVTDSRIGCQACEEHIVTYSINANSDWWHPEIADFGPGMMAARYSGFNLIQGCFADSRHWQKALTRLTFTTADGTEYEFRDKNTAGAPLDVPSCSQGASRGRVFVSADGSAATFISDTTIFDAVSPVAADSYFVVSGYLLLRDGTRYRIDQGKVSWIRDRNGNQTRFEPGKIIDPLNREISVSSEYDGIGILLAKQIGFKGFNGASRTIRIVYDDLPNALRPANAQHPAETSKTFGELFPGITDWGEGGNNAGAEFFTRVVSRVILPDGRSYRFYYNSYAELARVELPTGGAFEYDWTGDAVNMGGAFDLGPNYEIYRQLTERRVYKDATTLEGRTILGACLDLPGPGLICRQVDQVDPNNGNSLLTRTKHFYFGSSGPIGLFKEEIHYSKWNEGKEFKTEVFATNGTTVLLRTETNWTQRTSVPWWASNSTLFGPEPSMDPRVTFINTTLPDMNKVSRREFVYDDSLPFNNQADVYEYDFGTLSPGALVRRIHTSYVTAANYVGTDGLAVYAGTAAHIRSLPSERWVSTDANGTTKRSFTSFEYDNYITDSTHAVLTPRSDITGLCTTFTNTGVCANLDPQIYGTRGNLTSVTSYLQPASLTGPVTVAMQYDIAGNMIKFLDRRSIASQLYHATTIDYTDRFGSADHEARGDAGAPELNGNPLKHTYAFPTLITNPLGHTNYSQFDYYLGQPVNAEDENGIVSSGRYDDALDRPTQIKRAINTGLDTQTTFAYDDEAHTITTSSDRDSLNDNVLISKVLYDKLGRTTEARQYEGDGHFIVTKTEYNALGRAFKTSNPYRPWQTESAVWTTTAFDGLGRVISVTTPDGSIATTSYSGNTTTVTDQTGKRRKSVTDAVGRLIEVYEDPDVPGGPTGLNYQTTYLYDVMDNLVKVTQGGQERFFMYDSLGRLIRARQPEQATLASLNLSDPITNNSTWSIGYQYDEGGNLTQKTDARGVVSTYTYDRLNRNTTTDYSDTASINPDVTRLYDGATKGIGKLWSSEAGGTEQALITGYDELGRPLVLQQSFKLPNNTWKLYQTSRNYNLAGGVTTQFYPSNHSVTYNYDAAGRVADKDALNPAFKGNLGDGATRTYSKGIIYAASGQLTQEQFGTAPSSVYHKLVYNSRQQLAEILLSTTVGSTWDRGKILNYFSLQCEEANCNATDNNGNLRKQEVYIPGVNPPSGTTSWYQQYDYDELNRLKRVHEYTGNTAVDWQQEFDYDRWGNRTINASGTWIGNQNNPPNPLLNETQFDTSILASTNRLQAPGDQSLAENQKRMRYDPAGNLINDTYTGAGERLFDAQNRMVKAWGGDTQWQFYTYNAGGQRTRRKINNQETWQVYGFDGELLAEYAAEGATNNPTKEYGYRNGQLLISADAGISLAPPVFADDFNDNSLNTSFWGTYSPGTPTVSEQAQQLQVALSPNTAAYNGVFSNSTYDLTNRMVQVESVQAVSQSGWCENFLELELNANNYFMIQVGAGTMLIRARVNGVNDQTIIPFDGVANRFWRIRHDQSANLINFETSATGSVWLTRKTVTPGFSLTSLKFHLVAGAYGAGNSNPGTAKYDNFKLLSSTTGPVSLTVPNGGFEIPVLGSGNWQYAPSSASWSFANGGGISGNNSAFTGVPSAAPEGVQVAFLQATGEMSQAISGFQAGVDYLITFSAIQRLNCCNTGGQDIGVYVDSTQIGSIHPGNSSYTEYSFPFTTTAGSHTIKLIGLNPLGGDHTAFIDNVRITGSPKPGYGVQWLVADQLGTPRMVLDETGSLANIKRHDYLPFGEELLSQGLRTTAPGYAIGDGVRQQFTQKERDIETGLDYFINRYYSSVQGRYLSVDPQNAEAASDLIDPQGWNGYAYVKNNPCTFTDPDGRCICLWERFKNAAYGFRSNEQVQALEDKWRNYLREKQQQYGTLIWNEPGNSPFIVDPNTLSRDQVFYYARRLRDAEYDRTLQVYSAEDVQKIREAQGAAQPPPVPVLATWRSVTPSRPLDKMGHAKKHMSDFQEIDPSLTKDDVAKILEHVRKVGRSSPTQFGGKAFEATVEIGGKSVTVKVVESSGGLIKTGYPVP